MRTDDVNSGLQWFFTDNSQDKTLFPVFIINFIAGGKFLLPFNGFLQADKPLAAGKINDLPGAFPFRFSGIQKSTVILAKGINRFVFILV